MPCKKWTQELPHVRTCDAHARRWFHFRADFGVHITKREKKHICPYNTNTTSTITPQNTDNPRNVCQREHVHHPRSFKRARGRSVLTRTRACANTVHTRVDRLAKTPPPTSTTNTTTAEYSTNMVRHVFCVFSVCVWVARFAACCAGVRDRDWLLLHNAHFYNNKNKQHRTHTEKNHCH